MRRQPYKLILTLLVLSVVFVLVLQAFWIHSFYRQKKEEFSRGIYSALEQVSTRLYDRENIRTIQQNIVEGANPNSRPGDFRWSTVVSKTTSYTQVLNAKTGKPEVRIIRRDTLANNAEQVSVTDSVVKIFNGGTTIVAKTATRRNGKNHEIDKLVDKMLMEIKVIDTDERNADTISNIIKRAFNNKGLFLPFEFALKKVFKTQDEILAQSPGFRAGAKSFVSDLSANKVFSNHNFLFVQFPGEGNFVFSGMKNILLLSAAFSLLIIGVFYYTMLLILRQKKLNEVKNDFINNMTHELKTPIATISLATDAILNPLVKDNDEKFRDYTRILKEENRKLNNHVERVLQIALLDKGELRLHKKRINLSDIIKAAIDTHKLQVQKQNASVHFRNPGEVYMNGDETHLLAVFNNLLDNALKYCNDPCIIEIWTSIAAGEIVIHVKDNGIGIDSSMREKVFDKFYRAQGGNLHDVKGFGLGLSYARSIIEAHEGRIELQSEYGKGSEFILYFKSNA